jgi:hypothetical protein
MPVTNTPGRTPEPGALLPVPPHLFDGTPLPEDWTVHLIRRVLEWQMEEILTKPSQTPASANARARDIRTMTELVRTLERLDAAARRREGKAKKPKAGDDENIKQAFIRRLDQLLAARNADERS